MGARLGQSESECLEQAEKAMVRRMCKVSLSDRMTTESLRNRLGIKGVLHIVKVGRLR